MPDHPDALANLANIQFGREDFTAAAASYQRAFVIRRDAPAGVWVRRALAQRRSGDLAGAEDSLREAARIAPDETDVQVNLASACAERHRWVAAEAPLLRALTLDPVNPYALSMLAHARQHRCEWSGLDDLFCSINRQLENGNTTHRHPANPFPVLAMPTSPRAQLHAAERWARGFAPSPPLPRPAVTRGDGERLRIGFVSSDLREHPMAHLQVEHWERIDRGRFETYGYSLLPRDSSAIGQRVAAAFDRYADVSGDTLTSIAQRIRNDRIAILFDLNGYTTHSREHLFAQRPAPIQINSIGFPGTLGADWYDYILVDRFAVPEAMQPFHAERLWPMPHSFYPSDTTREPRGTAPSRAECGLPERGFVFCCFNKAYKILPDVFAIWMRLLDAVPESVLWLLESGPDTAQNLLQRARRAGIDPLRLVFAPHVPVEEHLARHAAADLFVDTFPYGAHTTSNDALLAGLPVVTCAGETLVSRIAGSQLHAIGLPELVTESLAEYEALALRLAREPASLTGLRTKLAANRLSHPLFDMARYTQDFEALLLRTWDERHRL
jgi:predicted O-linked N-acetylglucosamine transferase (SPINDLY family)